MALGPNNEFDVARKRAQQQENASLQGQRDALARRAAQTGGGVSGALVKQEQVASDASAQRLQSANEGIDAAQRTEERRIAEREADKTFAREERLGGQDFGAGQSALQRAYGTQERLGGQDFGAGQSALQRAYGTTEREASQKYGTGERLGSQAYGADMLQKQHKNQMAAIGEQAYLQNKNQIAAIGEQSYWQNKNQIAAIGEQSYLQNKNQIKAIEEQAYHNKELLGAQQTHDVAKFMEQMGLAREEFEQQKMVDQWNKDIADKMLAQKGPLESLFSGIGGLGGNAETAGGRILNYYFPGLNVGTLGEDTLSRLGFG